MPISLSSIFQQNVEAENKWLITPPLKEKEIIDLCTLSEKEDSKYDISWNQ